MWRFNLVYICAHTAQGPTQELFPAFSPFRDCPCPELGSLEPNPATVSVGVLTPTRSAKHLLFCAPPGSARPGA
jgi:hypothetical protein